MTNEEIAVWLRRKIREDQNIISRKERYLEQVKGGSHLQDWLYEESLRAEIVVWKVAADDFRELLDMLTHNMEDNV